MDFTMVWYYQSFVLYTVQSGGLGKKKDEEQKNSQKRENNSRGTQTTNRKPKPISKLMSF